MEYAVAIDVGGTMIKYALVNENYELEFSGKIETLAQITAEVVKSQILKAIHTTLDFAGKNHYRVKGIAIGSPGIIDETNRIILGGADNIVGWKDINLADLVEKEFNLPVVVDNDANIMALGEVVKGAAKGFSNVIFLTIGTGIGGGILINGKLFNGYKNKGGELGHITLFADGEACSCGSVGCLEQYASTRALVQRYVKRCECTGKQCPNEVDGKYIVDRYKDGDVIANEIMDEHCYFLGRGLAGLINIFSPERVVIGGGISEAGEFYVQKISKTAFKYAIPDCTQNTVIVSAQYGNKASLIGAASLVFK